ncbi:MAG: hypothetical protein GY839_01865 [candidate division Zixibacteria bacterium]|nr:hypothetical protein [candidate division Zixibacteria bacterium]
MRFNFVKQTLIGASLITAIAHIIGAFLGYFREAVTASYFGTTAILDAFILAFTIPELITTIIFSSMPTALIPILKKIDVESKDKESDIFWCGLLNFAIILALISFMIYLFRGNILYLLASNLSVESVILGKKLMTIFSFYIFFRGCEFYLRSWLFREKHFIIPATSNIIITVIILASLFVMYGEIGIEALAYGWLLGSIILFIINIIAVIVVSKTPVKFSLYNPWLTMLFKSVIIIASVEIVSMVFPLIDRYLAVKYLDPGVISALRFAMIIIVLPNRIFAVAFSTASFPWIADHSQNGNMDRLRIMYKDSLRMLFFIMGLIAIGVAIFSEEIVLLALMRGAFDEGSLHLTAGPLRMYALGIAFSAAYIYQMRYYYALMEYKKLGSIKLIMLLIKIILSYILIRSLKQDGLALASALTWFSGFLIMSLNLSRKINCSIRNLIDANGFKILALAVVIIFFWLIADNLWVIGHSTLEVSVKLIVLGIAGTVIYFGLAILMKIPEPKKLYEILLRRIHKAEA